MPDMLKQDFSRYRVWMSSLVEQALMACPPRNLQKFDEDSLWLSAVAAEVIVHPAGRYQYPMQLALEGLARRQDQLLADPAGHRRPIYWLLALHLSLRAWRDAGKGQPSPDVVAGMMERLGQQAQAGDGPIDLHLWRLLCLMDHATLTDQQDQQAIIAGLARQATDQPGRDGALHRHDPEESLDAWTYRELVGLHALHGLAMSAGDDALTGRCRRIVAHHVDNTQPDNTTNQPWALAAFLMLGVDSAFADQQLHDATTQGSLSGAAKAPGLVACLLLADALASLPGGEAPSHSSEQITHERHG